MTKVSCVVGFIAALFVCCCTGQTIYHYDIPGALAWLQAQGCNNASRIPICPGGVPCTSQEFIARMLAAGGVIALDPNVVSNAAYQSYLYNGSTFNFTDAPTDGFGDIYEFLDTIGWNGAHYFPGCSNTNISACYPSGGIIVVQGEVNGFGVALGNDFCSFPFQYQYGVPHCNIFCELFVPGLTFYPPSPPVNGPLLGSYTPNNQTYQDFTFWPNVYNTLSNATNMALNVLEVHWSPDDATAVLAELNYRWSIDAAVPIITWMPYPYKSTVSPTPNNDVVNGMYDDCAVHIDAIDVAWEWVGPRLPAVCSPAKRRPVPLVPIVPRLRHLWRVHQPVASELRQHVELRHAKDEHQQLSQRLSSSHL